MKILAQSNESNLDIAENIEDLLTDITLGVMQNQMDAEDVLDYIEEYISHEVELLIFKLRNGYK